MGRIKTTLVKRTARTLLVKSPELFTPSFEHDKRVLGSNTMPSKRIRNITAGYLARLKKHEPKPITETTKE